MKRDTYFHFFIDLFILQLLISFIFGLIRDFTNLYELLNSAYNIDNLFIKIENILIDLVFLSILFLTFFIVNNIYFKDRYNKHKFICYIANLFLIMGIVNILFLSVQTDLDSIISIFFIKFDIPSLVYLLIYLILKTEFGLRKELYK
nr:hypothetical protein [uncultured Peptostreptococcus sp.]